MIFLEVNVFVINEYIDKNVYFARTHTKTYTLTTEKDGPCKGGGEEWEE